MRPFPANPCDPYIPRKNPEAEFTAPDEDLYLSFRCSPSAEPSGLYTVKDVVDLQTVYGTYPGHANAVLDRRYLCPGTNNQICFEHLVRFNVALNYSTSMLPIMGNTQDYLTDAAKINNYLSYYLNGTVQQADNGNTNTLEFDDIYRLENFSGPLKKLLSYESQRVLRQTLGGNNTGTQYHNYQITGDGRIRSNTGTNPNTPFASLEDITSEVTISLPTAQPTNMDGNIVPGTLALTIGSADSRLYFPHMRNSNALSQILASISRPGFVYDSIYTPISASSQQLVSQNIPDHQGDDGTTVQTEDYRTIWRAPNNNTRNTEVIEGRPAPARLYESDPLCTMSVSTRPGDDFVGSTINSTLSFIMLFRYTPELFIGNLCPAGLGNCTNRPCADEGQTCTPNSYSNHCCWGSCPDHPPDYCQTRPDITNTYCVTGLNCSSYDYATCGANSSCCEWIAHASYCPAWPERDLRSSGRIAVYTKTPLIERIYDNLVASASSVLHRFTPHRESPSAPNSNFSTGRTTQAGGTIAQSSAASPDLHDVSISGGNSLYFAHLGSLFNHFLGNGGIANNVNLQCFFRPRGSCRPTLSCAADLDQLLSAVDVDPACTTCTSELGELATRILNTAGTVFGVPAADIFTAMWHEGATWPEYAGQFTDENVLRWSLPEECGGEPMPRCDNDSEVTQPPFGFIRMWFYADGPDAPWTAVTEIDPSRTTEDQISRCNFLDAAFAAAKTLSVNSSTHTGMTCGPYTFNSTVRPRTCSDWSDEKIAQSQVGYVGQCPNTSAGGPYETLPYSIEDLVSMYNGYRCQ